MEELLSSFINNLDYSVIILLMAIESSFIPFPSEVVVPPAAYMAYHGQNNMHLLPIVLCATLGAIIGSLINYGLSYFLGRPIIYKFANSKLGHMCLLSAEKIENAEAYFRKHGAIGTFVGRLVPAVRQLISIPAGLSKMNLGKFVAFTTLGAGIWNCVLAGIGYALGPTCTPEQLEDTVKKYSHEIGIAILGIVLLIAAFMIIKHYRKKA